MNNINPYKSNKFSFGAENLFLKTLSTLEDSKRDSLFENNNPLQPSISEQIILKLKKLEDYYKDKMEIYEKQIQDLKCVNKKFQEEKNDLIKKNEELLLEINLKEGKYNEILQTTISENELNLRNQYEERITILEKEIRSSLFENEQLRKNFEIERKQNNEKTVHILNMKRSYEEEIQEITEKYNNLLNIHTQMLEFDISKNALNLKNINN